MDANTKLVTYTVKKILNVQLMLYCQELKSLMPSFSYFQKKAMDYQFNKIFSSMLNTAHCLLL